MLKLFKKSSGQKGYLYLFFKIAVFLLIAFLFDFAVGGIFSNFYFKQTSGWEYRTKYSIEDTRADILIFGASRAQQQYNPTYFEERLNQTCYNVGRDGEPIFYYYGVLKGVLNRYKPKMIILDIENRVFAQSQSSYDRISVFLPFYKDHPEMRSIIEMRSPYEKLKLKSRIYPYNSMLFKIAMGNTASGKKRNDDIKGYVPLLRSLNEPIRNVNLTIPYIIDSNKVNCYTSFLDDCIQSGIKLYIVCSPYYINAIGTDTSMTLAKSIAKTKNIEFIDFSKDQTFLQNSKLFDDTVHVNKSGSKIFSNKLVDSIIFKSKGAMEK